MNQHFLVNNESEYSSIDEKKIIETRTILFLMSFFLSHGMTSVFSFISKNNDLFFSLPKIENHTKINYFSI
jgi:hypothetical protein